MMTLRDEAIIDQHTYVEYLWDFFTDMMCAPNDEWDEYIEHVYLEKGKLEQLQGLTYS